MTVSGPPERESSYEQLSLVATSKDGLRFEAQTERLGNAYFRVFKWNGTWYALAMPGVFYRSVESGTDSSLDHRSPSSLDGMKTHPPPRGPRAGNGLGRYGPARQICRVDSYARHGVLIK